MFLLNSLRRESGTSVSSKSYISDFRPCLLGKKMKFEIIHFFLTLNKSLDFYKLFGIRNVLAFEGVSMNLYLIFDCRATRSSIQNIQ